MTRRPWPEPFEFVAGPPLRLHRLAQVFLLAAVLVAGLAGLHYLRIAGADARFWRVQAAMGLALSLALHSRRRRRTASLHIAVGVDGLLRIDGVAVLPAAAPLACGRWLWLALHPVDVPARRVHHILEFDSAADTRQARLRRWMCWALPPGH
ncbi:hypothetical protein [Derxia lacustris]|uniref:hypothetical protein n=1 Tax=Derxia lacustris TaxID=764842 RepID=UPI000A1719F2|nr:hypothetical protein [Derxia lacustris]